MDVHARRHARRAAAIHAGASGGMAAALERDVAARRGQEQRPMITIASFILPVALSAAPTPAPAYGVPDVLRITGGLGLVLEDRHWADDQTMMVLAVTPTLYLDEVVVGLDVQVHSTGHNDEKTDLGGRLGGAWSVSSRWDGTLTFDLGWREQTKSRFVADTFLGSFDDEGVSRSFAYAGTTLALHRRARHDQGLVYGFEFFARADLARPFRVADEGDGVTFGGTVEVGLSFKAGWDALLGR